ncbi:Uu.00g107690.m01.CDS01 [Anthostomella pinea]|uniref:Uu.00g107690.m01.CDS01 n=1 Tax=Anthostomella pinea TaxID=933095 RepID=A0AAI8YG52_9PEZI|nr:Uu.00g107690.m01.CDS01 [Anthostomella pinea]
MQTQLPVKLVVLGDGGVGKTALTIRLCLRDFVETYEPTIKDSYRYSTIIDDERYILEVLDTAGDEAYARLRDQWVRNGQGFLLVYSISSRPSFATIGNLFQQVLRGKECNPQYAAASPPKNLPIVIVGNKSDRLAERQVSITEGSDLAEKLGCGFIEISTKIGSNVEKAFHDAARVVQQDQAEQKGEASDSALVIKGLDRQHDDCSCIIL